jgi:hypothetical protein
LRDVVNARELEIELGEALARATTAMNTSIGKLLDYDRTKLRNFTDRMPSTRVAVSLKAAYHKDNRHVWTTNDIHDIDARRYSSSLPAHAGSASVKDSHKLLDSPTGSGHHKFA